MIRSNWKAYYKPFVVLDADALFLYDRIKRTILASEICSPLIREITPEGEGLEAIWNEQNHKLFDQLSISGCWGLAENTSDGCLSINLCLDKERVLYLTLQAVVLEEPQEHTPRLLLCSLHFSCSDQEQVYFLDRGRQIYWEYDLHCHIFREKTIATLTRNELEVIRLSRLGFCEREIGKIIHKSHDSIRWYKRNIYEKLGVSNIQACVAYCELFHLL